MLQKAAMCSIHIEQEKSLLPPVLRHRCISEAKRGRIGLREKESAAAFCESESLLLASMALLTAKGCRLTNFKGNTILLQLFFTKA